ncbi:DUF7662 domain-containing protein [Brevundimonas sp. VNH65]|uniref:DUF7662 domain-containing protein n=1 Tax=Brevundimonas sp. VNH65 TaxID=3400917 RepID=UPI003C077C63
MSKYEPLTHFLIDKDSHEVPMTFAEIEKVVGFKLPEKASGIRAWWSNNPSNNVMTRAWLAAGFVSERVDMGARRLVFRRKVDRRPSPTTVPTHTPPSSPGRSLGLLTRIRDRMAGTTSIPSGADVTAPTGEVWDADR